MTIATLNIPNVTDVSSTFEGCSSLTNLTGFELPSTCTAVDNLFNGCYALRTLSMDFGPSIQSGENWYPPNLETLNDTNIENGCIKMTNCSTLKNVNNLYINNGDYSDMFNGCTNLTTLTLTMGANITGLARFIKGCSKITSNPFTEIPESCSTIEEMFNGTNITDISGMVFGSRITNATSWIPPNLTTANNVTIKNNKVKFKSCSTLIECNNLTFTDEVTTIDGMFNSCINLNSVENLILGEYCNNLNRTFENCTSLERLVIPELPGDRYIDFYRTFTSCGKLKYLEFYDKVMTVTVSPNDINAQTMYGCNNLVTLKNFKVKYADRIVTSDILQTYINTEAPALTVLSGLYTFFGSCSSLKETPGMGIYNNSARLLFHNFQGDITDFIIGEEVTNISYLFRNKPRLTHDIEIPSHITDCTSCFKNSTKITHIHSNWKNEFTNGITSTDCYAGCIGITHCDGIDLGVGEYVSGLDEVPRAWGGYEFSKSDTGIYRVQIPTDNFVWSTYGNTDDGNTLSLIGNKIVNWGDGTVTTKYGTHVYAKAGEYIIKGNTRLTRPGLGAHAQVRSCLKEVIQFPTSVDAYAECYVCNKLERANFERCRMSGHMFAGCSSLMEVNLTNATIHDNVARFLEGTPIKNVDFSTTTFENITDISQFIYNCSNLTTLDVSRLSTSKVTNMNGFCKKCASLVNVIIGDGWDTSLVQKFDGMFQNTILDDDAFERMRLSDWNVSSGISFNNMFSNNTKITRLDLSNWIWKSGLHTNNSGLNINSFVGGCTKLQTIKFNENVPQVRFAQGMFTNTPMLSRIENCPIHGFDNGDMGSMYWAYGQDTHIYNGLYMSFSSNGKLKCWTTKPYITFFNKIHLDTMTNLGNAMYDYASEGVSRTLSTNGYLARFSEQQIAIFSNKGWTLT
jgi:surface protein